MKTTTTLGALALSTALVATAVSATTVEEVVAQMEAQGYTEITVETSLLGRTEIEGEKDGEEREVVLSKEGEVLRDEIELEDDDEDDHDDTDDDNDDDSEDDTDQEKDAAN